MKRKPTALRYRPAGLQARCFAIVALLLAGAFLMATPSHGGAYSPWGDNNTVQILQDTRGAAGAGYVEPHSTVGEPATVTASDSSNATVGEVIATIAVGNFPLSAVYDPVYGYVYIINHNSDDVTIINGTSVIGTVATGASPWYSAYDGRNGAVYVPNWGTNTVTVINGTNNVGTVVVGEQPSCTTYDEQNGFIYASAEDSHDVSVIDGVTIVGTVSTGPDSYPQCVVYDTGNDLVYATSQPNVTIVSGTAAVGSIPLNAEPGFGTYDNRNGFVYVTTYGGFGSLDPYLSNVSVLNGSSLTANVVAGASAIYTAPSYDPANGFIYVMNTGGSNVTAIDGTSVVGNLAVGESPGFAAVDDSSEAIYVPNSESDNVSVLNGTAVIGSIPVGVAPAYAVYDNQDGFVYVLNSNLSGLGSVSVIDPNPPTSVTFRESGLAPDTNWSVSIDGRSRSDVAPGSITLYGIPNGTYPYSVNSVPGYVATPSSGLVSIEGSVAVAVAFDVVPPGRYVITLNETGLPQGTNWTAAVNGTVKSGTGSNLQFVAANGTYSYAAEPTSRWNVLSDANGTTTIAGRPVTINLTYSYSSTLTFLESGIPNGTRWMVQVTSIGFGAQPTWFRNSTTPTALFPLSNGTYSWEISSTGYLTASGTGLIVSGQPLIQTVTMTPSPGLPSGVPSWWLYVTVGAASVVALSALAVLLLRRAGRRRPPIP